MFTFENSFLRGENKLLLTNKEAAWVWLLKKVRLSSRIDEDMKRLYCR